MLRLFIYSIAIFLISCHNSSDPTTIPTAIVTNTNDSLAIYIKEVKLQLQQGDLVVRSGNDFTSNAFKTFSKKDKTFSHSGFVFREDSNYYVYHLVSGTDNPSGNIKREIYDSFINPRKNIGLGIFRYDMTTTEINGLHNIISKYYTDKLTFDKELDLVTDDQMYCSEMVYKALLKVTHGRITIKKTVLENVSPKLAPLLPKKAIGESYIALDDLYLNEHCKEISKLMYSSVNKQ